jgi:aminobenzoyl-glutamate utilization protein B
LEYLTGREYLVAVEAKTAIDYINQKADMLTSLSDDVWKHAELALHEDESAKALQAALAAEGFSVEAGAGGMPTAFVATWGKGRPMIGFLGEYDALSGLSQKTCPTKAPVIQGAPGHGCGHNLLGVASLGAAIALKQQMQKESLPGTIMFFGCPAEENLSGKAFMAREGVFDDCDVCLTWHAGWINRVSNGSSNANNACNITFLGRTAHAAGDPYNGRSALDAVQLMNMGVEFLREHMPTKARVHYVITNGGDMPNVVPAKAKVWYLIRAPQRDQVDDLYDRVLACAKGAALMTGTTFEVELIKAIWNVLNNTALEDLLEECMIRVGAPKFSEANAAFAREIRKTFEENIPSLLAKSQLSKDQLKEIQGQILNDTVITRPLTPQDGEGSTDVGDVSWCCPTAQFTTACNAIGTPGHSWQYCAQAGMNIGHQGMLTAAKILAEAGYALATKPEIIRRAKAEFDERTGGKKYYSAMPPEQKPAFHQFAKQD